MQRCLAVLCLAAVIIGAGGCGMQGLLVNVERSPSNCTSQVDQAKISALEARAKALEERVNLLEKQNHVH
jgi:hypothetical protein